MGMDLGIADRIRAKGVTVVEVAGWQTRTTSSSGCVCLACLWHHTAGSATGTVPSLGPCIYGRGGPNPLAGPLCQVLQSREPNPAEDKAYVIAAGKANHAGEGVWGLASGNGETMGVEVEHVGTTTQPIERHEITARIMAALLEGPGAARSGAAAARHAEYALPHGRKIDFALTDDEVDADWMRARVGWWIGRTIIDVDPLPPTPDPEEDDDMAVIKYRVAPAAAGAPETFAYLLGDGTLIDRDHKGGLIDANEAKVYDPILMAKPGTTPGVNQAQVDQTQQVIQAATRQRFGIA